MLLQNAKGMFTKTPDKIVYCYTEYQPLFGEMKKSVKNITFHQGLPEREQIEEYSEGMNHVILVLDDLMLKITQSEDCVHLFTVTSHHRNITCVFLTQNLYAPGKYARSISLNCMNVILFKNYRDARQVLTFGSQILPGQVKYFKDAYEKSTSKLYGYMLVDLCPHTDKTYQLRTHIFPNEDSIVYVPRV